MPKIIVNAFLTLDGVMQAPGGPDEDPEGGFLHGGWQAPYDDDVVGRLVTEGFADADGFLLGRKTYDIFANYWPKVTDPIIPSRPPSTRGQSTCCRATSSVSPGTTRA
jgi:dihydrofolate reductase